MLLWLLLNRPEFLNAPTRLVPSYKQIRSRVCAHRTIWIRPRVSISSAVRWQRGCLVKTGTIWFPSGISIFSTSGAITQSSGYTPNPASSGGCQRSPSDPLLMRASYYPMISTYHPDHQTGDRVRAHELSFTQSSL